LEATILVVFSLVYLGMILGGLPWLALDRAGIALLGAIALIAVGALSPRAAWDAIDVPTIALLFGMMVVSASLRTSGFYARVTARIAALDVSPSTLLAVLIGVAGALSAVLTNDIVCLAMAPLLVEACQRRGLAPIPFLLALCCASNVGSAATLIGNPQNILIGQTLQLGFAQYLRLAILPSVLGLAAVWAVISWASRKGWSGPRSPDPSASASSAPIPYDAFATWKTIAVTAAVMLAFLLTPWPREVVALAGVGVLLVSRRTRSRDLIAMVDGQLLVLFIGLFVVNHALQSDGLLERGLAAARDHGVDPSQPVTLFWAGAVLSNLVSNVPATMLLLPSATHALAGPILALATTLAGNLIIVGSIANIIVVDSAASHGVKITWREHARIGVPVTLITLAIAAAWLAWA
jgi:Na+/H+ antiporter NhaD/arsenite permease-like protein